MFNMHARWYASAFTVAAIALLSGPALAELDDGLPPSVEAFAFDAADSDGDGLVSEAEMARDAAAGFSGLDADGDGDGLLTPDELGDHDPAHFERVDTDGDGALTFGEVTDHKRRGLEAADRDGDGSLSFDEMMNGAAAEHGVQP